MVVEEDAIGVEASADGDELLELGIDACDAFSRHEVDLSPMRAGVELAEGQ